MEASYKQLKLHQALAESKIVALQNARRDMVTRTGKKEKAYDLHLHKHIAPGYEQAMDNVYLDRAIEDQRPQFESNDEGSTNSPSADTTGAVASKAPFSDNGGAEEQGEDEESDDHHSFHTAAAQHEEYDRARKKTSSDHRGSYFGTYAPSHTMSPAARAIHEKVQAHSRNWSKEHAEREAKKRVVVPGDSQAGKETISKLGAGISTRSRFALRESKVNADGDSSALIEPISLDDLVIHEREQEKEQEQERGDDEVDGVLRNSEEEWSERGELRGLEPPDEDDTYFPEGQEYYTDGEEEGDIEVLLPPEPTEDEYLHEVEEIDDTALPPPPVNQSKRRLGQEWVIHYDGQRNRRYYFNTLTGESSWRRPKLRTASLDERDER